MKAENKHFIIELLLGILIIVSLITIMVLGEHFNSTNKKAGNEITDSLPNYNDVIPKGMTEEEFTREMYKGVQGNFTLEQVDSMQREWAKQDSIDCIKP